MELKTKKKRRVLSFQVARSGVIGFSCPEAAISARRFLSVRLC